MSAIETNLRDQIEDNPDADYDVIVRTSGDTEPVTRFCAQCGMTVHSEFRLVPGLSVTGKGRDLLALADNPRVISIESDREVSV